MEVDVGAHDVCPLPMDRKVGRNDGSEEVYRLLKGDKGLHEPIDT